MNSNTWPFLIAVFILIGALRFLRGLKRWRQSEDINVRCSRCNGHAEIGRSHGEADEGTVVVFCPNCGRKAELDVVLEEFGKVDEGQQLLDAFRTMALPPEILDNLPRYIPKRRNTRFHVDLQGDRVSVDRRANRSHLSNEP